MPISNPYGQGYLFDKNGNLTTDPTGSGRNFTFNAENKQSEVRDASNPNQQTNIIGRYFYDGEGKRVKKVTNTETTVFVYSNGKLVAEYSTATPTTNPTTSYTMTDQLDSPRVITNALGEVTSRRDFKPFGEELPTDINYRTPNRKYGVSDNVRQRFTGYQKDTETQLDFAEARMYQNLHGRFTAVDPLLASGKSANPQTFNRYVYCLNNPVVIIDPTGMMPDDWYIKDDGNIEVVRTDDAFDRFFVWDENQKGYINKAELAKNENGLVEFPQSGYGFTSYNSFENGKNVEPGGSDNVVKEQTGTGDHWVQPIVAAALFGFTNQLKNDYGTTLALGDMSSSNGSDPWNPNDLFGSNHGHHGGHGHFKDRTGLDIDFRYVDKNGVSQKTSFATKNNPLDKNKNQSIFDLAKKWGFTENYGGTKSGITGTIKNLGDHNNHGHLGFGGLKVTELKYDRRKLNMTAKPILGDALFPPQDRIIP